MKDDEDSARLTRVLSSNAVDLLGYLERRIDPVADAADVLSEVMIVAWKRLDRLPADETQARMWLFAIAARNLSSARRSGRRRSAATERLRREIDRVQATRESEPEAMDAAHDVRAAIAGLPASLRELVRLVHWEGFTVAEAGRISGVGASTARSRYARAKELLRAALGDAPAVDARETPSTAKR